MNTLAIVLMVAAALLVLLWNLRLGGRVEYGENGLRVQLRIGLLYITLFPRPKKAKKKKKPAKKPVEPPKPKEESGGLKKLLEKTRKLAGQAGDRFLKGEEGGELGLVLDAIPEVFELLGETVSQLCVEEMTVHYSIPGRHDAAGAAIQYGLVYSTGGVVCTLMDQHLTVKKRSVGAVVDFNEEKTKVFIRLNLSYRFGQLVSIAVHALKKGIKFWKRYQTLQEK